MDALLIARMLRKRAILSRRDRWSRDDLLSHQLRAVQELRHFAVERSRFYARLHHGLDQAPLDRLPVVTKQDLMEAFDDVVTDRRLRLADVKAELQALSGDSRLLDRYRVVATGGTTGLRGIFLSDPHEWSWVMASYVRANDWAHAGGGVFEHRRVAVISSRNPEHQSARVGMSLASPFVETLRIDATHDLRDITRSLDAFQPQSLVGYASMLRLLAEEQIAGRLSICPRSIMSASEVLSAESRRRIRIAFEREPYDVYAATETAGIASECEHHRGLHLYEDLVVTELVDEHHRPVPVGVTAAKVLVTVLFSRTQPLIRYEMSDTIRATAATCECGRPFALVEAVEGRREDTLVLRAHDGAEVRIHPNLLHHILDGRPVSGWQVEEFSDRLVVRVAGRAPLDSGAIERDLAAMLAMQGAAPLPVVVESVTAIPRTPLGKAPLVIARHRSARMGL